MNWIESSSSFRHNGAPVTRRKLKCATIFGSFEVFEAVGGKTFYRHPFLKSDYIGPTGFDNGCEEWFGKTKKPVESIEKGREICELAMDAAKRVVSAY